MKRLAAIPATLALIMFSFAPLARAADTVPQPRQNTNVVLVLDLAQIDIDKLVEYGTAKAKANGVAQADIDKGLAEGKEQVDQAKGFLTSFKDAGATKVYAFINATGAMSGGDFGVVVIPTASPESAKKVSDMLTGMVDPQKNGQGPASVSVAGNTVMMGSKGALAEPTAEHPLFATALAADAPAALRLVIDAKVFAPFLDNMKPEDKAAMQDLKAMALTINVPPAAAFSMSVTAKDADSAKKIADKYADGLAKGKEDPEAKAALGDPAPLLAALAPKVSGNTMSISLDTKQIEEVIVPAIAKMAAAEQKKKAAAGAETK